MFPVQPHDVVTNPSKYQLDEDEMDLFKNGLDFSIPLRFLKRTDVFCHFDMIVKFMKQELEDNQISTWLKNKLSQMANSYIYNIHRPSILWRNIKFY